MIEASIRVKKGQIMAVRVNKHEDFFEHIVYPLFALTQAPHMESKQDVMETFQHMYAFHEGVYRMLADDETRYVIADGFYNLVYDEETLMIPGVIDDEKFLYLYGCFLASFVSYENLSRVIALVYTLYAQNAFANGELGDRYE